MSRNERRRRNILENRSMFGTLRDFGNHRFFIGHDSLKEIFSIGQTNEPDLRCFDDKAEKGGIIVFSTDVNAVEQSENKIIDWCMEKYKAIKNPMRNETMQDKTANSDGITAMTVGKYLQGRYRPQKDGSFFTENSVSVEILGVSDNELFVLAEDIRKEFQQESVLVKSYLDGGVYFVE